MSAKQWPCQYIVLRLRPDPQREEFANVGVILYCENDNFLGGKLFNGDSDRLLSFFQDLAPETYESIMAKERDALNDVLLRASEANVEKTSELFIKAQTTRRHRITVSDVKECSSSSPKAKIQALFDEYVT
jgi:hypothetical protein